MGGSEGIEPFVGSLPNYLTTVVLQTTLGNTAQYSVFNDQKMGAVEGIKPTRSRSYQIYSLTYLP